MTNRTFRGMRCGGIGGATCLTFPGVGEGPSVGEVLGQAVAGAGEWLGGICVLCGLVRCTVGVLGKVVICLLV